MTQWPGWPYAGVMVRALLILALALLACASESPFTPPMDSGAEVAEDAQADTSQPSDTATEDAAPPDAPLEASTDTGAEDTGRDAPVDVAPDADCDRDRDGHRALACGGDDCDDTREAVHPGAPEWCDGVDGDCDGVADALPDGGVDPGSAAFCRTSLTAGVTYDAQPARCVLPPTSSVPGCGGPLAAPMCIGCRRDGGRTICEATQNGPGIPPVVIPCT